jgi:tryptophan-rich sensory protein
MKLNHIIIPLITLATALCGSWITNGGMEWYRITLKLPEIAPGGGFIGMVWTIIFIFAAISVILFWNSGRGVNFKLIIALFIANALLNVLWSALFFGFGLIGWSIVEMIILNLSNLALIILLWQGNQASALLLVPYFLWVSFATYLAYAIWGLNK